MNDDIIYSSKFGYTDVAITTKRGRFTVRAERVSGSPEWPMTAVEREEKFLDCSRRALGDRGARDLHDKLSRIESLADVSSVLDATMPAVSAKRERAA